MAEQRVRIVAECVCDLPSSWLVEHNVDIMYFSVETDSGIFSDTQEITSGNLIEYMLNGGKKALSYAPSPDLFKKVFEKNLDQYEEVIHVAISSGVSLSCKNSLCAVEKLGLDRDRVHVFDTGHLSSGLGHFVVKAAEMAQNGCTAGEILAELEQLKGKVSTSFITEDVDFLYRNKRISAFAKKLFETFNIHPILMMKNGSLVLKTITSGNYRRACARYIKSALRGSKNIEKQSAFITHVGCSRKMLDRIKQEVDEVCEFDSLIVTKASATISSNCGPNTFGILFIRK